MEQDELLKRLEEEFKTIKEKLKFKTTLNELDKRFFVRDFILDKRMVSTRLSRMICARIVDTFNMWAGYLHGIAMPNPASMINVSESQFFSDSEKEDVAGLISRITSFTSRNTLIGLTKDKKEESKFIDESIKEWDKLKPKLVEIMKKVNKSWIEKSQPPKSSQS